MTIITIGIDLAKNIFAVHGVDAFGKVALVVGSPCSGAKGRRALAASRLSAELGSTWWWEFAGKSKYMSVRIQGVRRSMPPVSRL